jgi:hypothetical protein
MKRTISSSSPSSPTNRVKLSSSTVLLNQLPRETIQCIMDFIPLKQGCSWQHRKEPQYQTLYNHVNLALTCKDIHLAFTQHPYSFPLQLTNKIQSQITSHFIASCGEANHHGLLLNYMEALERGIKNQASRIKGDQILQKTKKPEWLAWRDGIKSFYDDHNPLPHIALDQRRVLYDKFLSRVTYLSVTLQSVSHYDDYDSTIQINGEFGTVQFDHHAHDDDCEVHFRITFENELISTMYGQYVWYPDVLGQVRSSTGISEEELSHVDLTELILFATPYIFGSNEIHITYPDRMFK